MDAAAEKSKPTEQEINLASQANEEFNSGNYEKCQELLEQQLAFGGNKDCLQHNLTIVRFYKSECKDHGSLLSGLKELDKSEAEPTKSRLLVKYNKAVVYFHRHMHYAAIEVLAPVISRLDTVDEENAALAGILMLRLLLATNQLNKAQAFLEFLQSKLEFGATAVTCDENSSAENLPSIEGFKHALKLLALITNVLNRKIVVIPENGSVEFGALKAHQYYIMKDFQMASKQLKKIDVEAYRGSIPSDELNACIANNMGVIHLRVRHYAIASKFFQKAIAFDKKISSNLRDAPLQHKSSAHSCEILYNMGIAMLHLRRPKEAFQCFLVPLKFYHSNPRLWFRMAESCIMDFEIKHAEDDSKPLASSSAVMGGEEVNVKKQATKTIYSSNSRSAAVPEPNLEFAALSLRNALTLAHFYKSGYYEVPQEEESDSKSTNWNELRDNNFCNPSKPISRQSVDHLLSAIYAAYSFVSLRLGDYVIALEMAQELLNMDKLSDAHKMLAHMYAGEAYIMMEKLAEAKVHLEPTFVSTLNTFDFETKDWEVKSIEAAQNIVRYNYSVALVLQGEFEAAQKILSTCIHPIVASKAKTLKMYMDAKKINH